jgi:hypothetical protein
MIIPSVFSNVLFQSKIILTNHITVGKQTHDLTVTASDSKTTQSGGDNRKKFPLGAALQVPQNFSFAPL